MTFVAFKTGIRITIVAENFRWLRKLFSAALVHRRGGRSAADFWPTFSVSFPSLRCDWVGLLVAAVPRGVYPCPSVVSIESFRLR